MVVIQPLGMLLGAVFLDMEEKNPWREQQDGSSSFTLLTSLQPSQGLSQKNLATELPLTFDSGLSR